jgi:hypothetical protein
MRQSKLMLSLIVFIFGFTGLTFAQVTLPEVKVVSFNYRYLNSVDNKELAMPVKRLELETAAFDLKNSEFYEDVYDNYFISFYIPEGSILAVYDKDGKLLRTAEKFKNIKIPNVVAKAVVTKYPDWKIAKDVYLVSYYSSNDESSKTYKLLLEKGNKRLRVKTNEKGEFL